MNHSFRFSTQEISPSKEIDYPHIHQIFTATRKENASKQENGISASVERDENIKDGDQHPMLENVTSWSISSLTKII